MKTPQKKIPKKNSKLFIVTGTTRGLGLKLCEEIKKGPESTLISIARQKNLKADYNLVMDLSDSNKLENSLKRLFLKIRFSDFKKVILIHNAATVTPMGGLHELDSKEIIHHHNLNITTPTLLIKNLVEKYFQTKKKTELIIVNISSGAAFHPIAGWSQYCASKAALHMLIKNLRQDFEKEKGFQAFSFSPGVMDTDMQGNIRAEKSKFFSRKKDFLELKKNKKLLSPETVAVQLMKYLNKTKNFSEHISVNDLIKSTLSLTIISTCSLFFSSCSYDLKSFPERSVAQVIKRGNHFEDVTINSGVSSDHSGSIAVGDYNNDFFPDFISRNRLYHNAYKDGMISFVDVTDQVGLGTMKGLPMFLDINNDGKLDIMTNASQLFIQQKNGKFINMAKNFGLQFPEKVYSLSFVDLNNDGFTDIVGGQSEIHDTTKGTFSFLPSFALLNVGGRKFVDISKQFSFDAQKVYNRGIHWADYDLDSKPDGYFSNYRLKENFLYKKTATEFINTAQTKGVAGEKNSTQYYDEYYKKTFGPQFGHTISSHWADFNNDGLLDLWVSNLVHKFVGMSNNGSYDYRGYVCDDSKIYKNTGAPHYKFVDVRKDSGIAYKPLGDWSKYKGDELWAQTIVGDYDNDGYQDVFLTQVYNLPYAHSLLYRNLGNFKFQEVSASEPIRFFDSYVAVWADVDRDGKLDLLTSGRPGVNKPHEFKIFRNITKNNNNYVKIKLVGNKSSKNPVTTQVKLFLNDGTVMIRQYDGVNGTHNQQSESTLHFGLGKRGIKGFQIRWNSGLVKNYTASKVNTIYMGVEP